MPVRCAAPATRPRVPSLTNNAPTGRVKVGERFRRATHPGQLCELLTKSSRFWTIFPRRRPVTHDIADDWRSVPLQGPCHKPDRPPDRARLVRRCRADDRAFKGCTSDDSHSAFPVTLHVAVRPPHWSDEPPPRTGEELSAWTGTQAKFAPLLAWDSATASEGTGGPRVWRPAVEGLIGATWTRTSVDAARSWRCTRGDLRRPAAWRGRHPLADCDAVASAEPETAPSRIAGAAQPSPRRP